MLVNNVTHIKRVTKELREQRRLHKTLVQNMSGVVYRCKWDREYTMEHISSQCYEDTGYQPEDLIDNKRISFNSLIQGGV
ncbi:MAG: hypothetical protein RBR30_11500 [Tenuifilaceae bacterium]|nr:hypothetical protein [Tenuifilaceae bacterium]